MSDSEHTRYVRLRADADREGALNRETRFSSTGQFEKVVLVDHRSLFNQHQRRMHQVVREHTRPGVAIFALHPQHGHAGHLWLEASEQVRAGTIGRHSQTDLFLPLDPDLSLRHLLVLVQRVDGALKLRIADLATPGGFQVEKGGVLRAVDADGTVVLRAAGYSLFAFPTGGPPLWNRDVEDPWATLPAREVVASARTPQPRRRRGKETTISLVAGPAEPAPERVADEPVAGTLLISVGGIAQRLEVGPSALERGLILGRYSRCSGDTSSMTNNVSRVHAVLIDVGGVVHVVDAGSTNGVVVSKKDVKCAPIEVGVSYSLGDMRVRWVPRS